MSNKITELEKLYAQTKEFSIGKQLPDDQKAKITITALSLDDMSLMDINKDASVDEQKKQTLLLLSKCTGYNPDDLKKVSFGFLEELMDCVLDSNNVSEDKVAEMKKTLQNQK